MSHELRTPLNGVIGVAEVLGRTRMNARQREMLNTVRSSALTLQGVLADLLDIARIESGRLDLACDRFAVGAVVRDAASLWRLEAEKKGLKLVVEVSPDAEADVESDQVRLRQIVVNLLSNAVKFTEEGEIVLTLARLARRSGPAAARGARLRHRLRAGIRRATVRPLRAGRRLGHPPLRRQRPGPGHLPRPGRAHGRADLGDRAAPARAPSSTSSCRCPRSSRWPRRRRTSRPKRSSAVPCACCAPRTIR